MKRLMTYTSWGVAIAVLFTLTTGRPLVAGKDHPHGDHPHEKHPHHKNRKQGHRHAWHKIQEAVCVVHPTQGNTAKGVVRFAREGRAVKVVADIEGLTPNAQHAIHIHRYGDCTAPDGKSAGGHYNPKGVGHALPDHNPRHAGDLGNLQADAQGKAHYELTVDNIMIVGPHHPILGRAVIVHAKPDDGGQPTGNAGARIGCGVIGIANAPANQPAPTTQPGG